MLVSEKPYAEVAVALPVFKTFTYEVPEPLRPLAAVGKRVMVPFRTRRVTGYILELLQDTSQTGVKKVFEILDDEPLFPAAMTPFFRWIADYYMYPIGEVVKGALPGGINITQVTRFRITDRGGSALANLHIKGPERTLLEILARRGPTGLTTLSRTIKEEIPSKTLLGLERSGLVLREQKVRPGRVRPKKERCVRSLPGKTSFHGLSPGRRSILEAVHTQGEVSVKALKGQVPSAARLVKKMAAEGLLELTERHVYRDPFGEAIEADTDELVLTEEQQAAVSEVVDALGRDYKTYLLCGITGSGKTEVYMRAVAAALGRGYQALVLVPEIALISQTERVFRARFGECIALLHSGLSEGERFDQWMRIVRGEARVAIGARSAVFAPFDRLSLIIVDEEHDDSYKQESNLRYHARDLAVVRAKLADAVALLGSATPSVQSYHNVDQEKFQGLNLRRRIEDRLLPEVTVIDLRPAEEDRPAKSFITEELKDAVSETLACGEQVLLFLNRRGFAPSPVCSRCGEPVRCKNCDITMTLHQGDHCFKCHYCGHNCSQATACRACGNPKIKPLGLGTEKIEAKVKTLFPEARVARMDKDTTARRGALVKILKDLRSGAIDILVGTQMVAKGHHYPNITLVGIVCADLSLNFPDFRAGERTFQLLAQVAGRAGRGSRRGRVILQTFNPEHFSILTASNQDYAAFYRHEIPFRRDLQYPPYSRLIQILVAGRDKIETAKYARSLGEACRRLQLQERILQESVQVLGPVAAPLSRIKGRYRWHLLLKGLQAGPLHSLCQAVVARIEKEIPKSVRVVVDVDPVDML